MGPVAHVVLPLTWLWCLCQASEVRVARVRPVWGAVHVSLLRRLEQPRPRVRGSGLFPPEEEATGPGAPELSKQLRRPVHRGHQSGPESQTASRGVVQRPAGASHPGPVPKTPSGYCQPAWRNSSSNIIVEVDILNKSVRRAVPQHCKHLTDPAVDVSCECSSQVQWKMWWPWVHWLKTILGRL